MAAEEVRYKNIGLRGLTVADTKISFIDGQQGILIYRGYRIEDLARNSTFPETAHLLLNGTLPTTRQLEDFEEKLTIAREMPGYVYDALRSFPHAADPMDVLQAMVPTLAMADPDLQGEDRDANVRMAIRLIARFPIVMAAWHRIRNGLEPLTPKPDLTHAGNFLYLMHGEVPDSELARDFDVCLILHADHTFNASTFACREVASTLAHMYAAVTAGVGALSGPLHGGANARVLQMLKEGLEQPDVDQWIGERMEAGQKIMGLGHAVYKTMDPRAKFLRDMSERLGKKFGNTQWYDLSVKIEEAATKRFEAKGKTGIKPNVDFFSASTYYVMGIPQDLMTPIFAISRISGWTAHIIEEKFAEAQGKPALYRPKAEYVGEYCGVVGCEYQPPESRQ